MIISASRRTDIAAFYSRWLMNRIREGYCEVPNPRNHKQIARISLLPQDVDVIVFWTRNPRPLLAYLQELDQCGYRYYFQFTLLDNPRVIDQHKPAFAASVRTFRELAERIGAERVIWRYDPIVLSNQTDTEFHIRTYEKIAATLRGFTRRSVISLMDPYRKVQPRLQALAQQGIEIAADHPAGTALDDLMLSLRQIADQHNMEIVSCAEERDLLRWGIQPGKCIDNDLIRHLFGIDVSGKKDPSQRSACGCVVSRDIGMYDTCLFGCQYCYATSSFAQSRRHYEAHDPDAPALTAGSG